MSFHPLQPQQAIEDSLGTERHTPDTIQRLPSSQASSYSGRDWSQSISAPMPRRGSIANMAGLLEEYSLNFDGQGSSTSTSLSLCPKQSIPLPIVGNSEIAQPSKTYTFENLTTFALLATKDVKRQEVLADLKQINERDGLIFALLFNDLYMQIDKLSKEGAVSFDGVKLFYDQQRCLNMGITVRCQGGKMLIYRAGKQRVELESSLPLCRTLLVGYLFSKMPEIQNLFCDTEFLVREKTYLITLPYLRQQP